jgi:hypothetical protein
MELWKPLIGECFFARSYHETTVLAKLSGSGFKLLCDSPTLERKVIANPKDISIRLSGEMLYNASELCELLKRLPVKSSME